MGMNAEEARAFYAMTNSVGFSDAKWLDAAEMREWVEKSETEPMLAVGPVGSSPKLSYLSF